MEVVFSRTNPCGCVETWLRGEGCGDGDKSFIYSLMPCAFHGLKHQEFREQIEALRREVEAT